MLERLEFKTVERSEYIGLMRTLQHICAIHEVNKQEATFRLYAMSVFWAREA